jgi:diguanylate cyclase
MPASSGGVPPVDFGTGYSSMAYLKSLPVHELKVDRSFVVPDDQQQPRRGDRPLHRRPGPQPGLRVVAEGVEDPGTWQQLDALGCDGIQGYYVSRPVPANDLIDWLEHQQPATPNPQPQH